MPKYVTLDWSEYTRLKDDLSRYERGFVDGVWLRDNLIAIIATPEDQKYYKNPGPTDPLAWTIPPADWRPLTNEQIIELVKEKFSDQ